LTISGFRELTTAELFDTTYEIVFNTLTLTSLPVSFSAFRNFTAQCGRPQFTVNSTQAVTSFNFVTNEVGPVVFNYTAFTLIQ
jgi:hypothetical protein